MIELLEFAFSSVWHFIGLTIWLCLFCVLVDWFKPFAGIVRVDQSTHSKDSHDEEHNYSGDDAVSVHGSVVQNSPKPDGEADDGRST